MLGPCDFFDFPYRLLPESSEYHLSTSIAGVLRLRAINRSVRYRSVRRFAQDDGFVEEVENIWLVCSNTERSTKSQALRMTALWRRLKASSWCATSQKDRKSHRLRMTNRRGLLKGRASLSR